MNWGPEANHFRDMWPCFCGIILNTSYEITTKKILSNNINVVKKRRVSNTWQFYKILLRDLSLHFVTRHLNSEWKYIRAHLFPEQSVWNVRWTKWQWDMLFLCVWSLRFSPVSIITPVFHTHSLTYHRCYMAYLNCKTIQKKHASLGYPD
jgi:hypothetical protein